MEQLTDGRKRKEVVRADYIHLPGRPKWEKIRYNRHGRIIKLETTELWWSPDLPGRVYIHHTVPGNERPFATDEEASGGGYARYTEYGSAPYNFVVFKDGEKVDLSDVVAGIDFGIGEEE